MSTQINNLGCNLAGAASRTGGHSCPGANPSLTYFLTLVCDCSRLSTSYNKFCNNFPSLGPIQPSSITSVTDLLRVWSFSIVIDLCQPKQHTRVHMKSCVLIRKRSTSEWTNKIRESIRPWIGFPAQRIHFASAYPIKTKHHAIRRNLTGAVN